MMDRGSPTESGCVLVVIYPYQQSQQTLTEPSPYIPGAVCILTVVVIGYEGRDISNRYRYDMWEKIQ